MLLTPEQVSERLSSPANLANRFGSHAKTIPIQSPGRKPDVPNLPPEVRSEIAFRSRLGERQTKLAAEFGTTQARVSQLERGKDKSINNDAINESVRDIAVTKLMESLQLITPEKLKKETAQGLSRVASNMAKVVNLTGEKNANEVTVVVYAPQLRQESSFKTVDI